MAKDADISKSATNAVLNSFIDSITKELKKKDGKVTVIGFGTFSKVHRKARKDPNLKNNPNIVAQTQFENCGVFEGLMDDGHGRYIASGWAILPERKESTDAVILTSTYKAFKLQNSQHAK